MGDKELEDTIDIDKIDYGISAGNYANDGIYYSSNKDSHVPLCNGKNVSFPIRLKIRKQGNNVFFSYEMNNLSSKKYELIIGTVDSTYNKIGFSINLGTSRYYEWLISNYANIYFNPNADIRMDFLFTEFKNYRPIYNKFYFDVISKNELALEYPKQVLEYIKNEIRDDRYIETEINDNITLKINDDENGVFFHPNLIYGFDDEKKILNIVYYRNGKPCFGELKYEDYTSIRNKLNFRSLISIDYNPKLDTFLLSKKRIKFLFDEFRTGENNAFYDFLLENGYRFGLDAFHELTYGHGCECALTDSRISCVLIEREKINEIRIKIFRYKKWIQDNDFDFLSIKISENIKSLILIRNLVTKREVQKCYREADFPFVSMHMKSIYEREKIITNKIIEILSDFQMENKR